MFEKGRVVPASGANSRSKYQTPIDTAEGPRVLLTKVRQTSRGVRLVHFM